MRAEAWGSLVETLPHLKPWLPSRTADISHFKTNEDGFLREEFFRFDKPENYPWSFTRCMEWIAPQKWIHTPTGTLEGGPYGCKWPILLILFIRDNMGRLANKQYPTYSAATRAEFHPRDAFQLTAVANEWTQALVDPTQILAATVDKRKRRGEELAGGEGGSDASNASSGVVEFVVEESENEWEVSEGVCESGLELSDRYHQRDGIEPQPYDRAGRSRSAPRRRSEAGSERQAKKAREEPSDSDQADDDGTHMYRVPLAGI